MNRSKKPRSVLGGARLLLATDPVARVEAVIRAVLDAEDPEITAREPDSG